MRSDFCSFLLGFGQILVRFLVKNGQIVGQIFPNFGQIIILTTLDDTEGSTFINDRSGYGNEALTPPVDSFVDIIMK